MKTPRTTKKVCAVLLLFALTLSTFVFPTQMVQARTITSNEMGTHGGYDYEFWRDSGTGTMVLKDGGAFSCQWSNINNILFRKGRKFDQTKTHQQLGNIVVEYAADYRPNGNSYLCIYGWTVDPLVEYYIVESWGNWRPPGAQSKGMITVDGGTYDIYETTRVNQPSIIGTATFQQYWSVRTSKKTSGTVSVSQHFKAWESMGMKMGKMYEVATTVEGYQSSGSADVYKNVLTIGGSIPDDPVDPVEPGGPGGSTMPENNGPGSRDAYSKIEAEEYNAYNSSSMEIIGTGSGEGIGYIESGDTLTYKNIDFGSGASKFTALVASGLENPTRIDIRLGSSTGTRIGTLEVGSTGGWNEYTELSTNVSSVTGKNDVVLVFSGPVNIDWFTFTKGSGTIIPSPTPTSGQDVKYGDLNGDGIINSMDASLLNRYILEISTSIPDISAADLNGDGIINSSDATLINRYILEVINKFPVEDMKPTPSPSPSNTPIPTGSGEISVPTDNINVPSFSQLQNNPKLPDPFTFINGSKVTSLNDWPLRRAEISALAQRFIYGEKPNPPESVTGSYGNGRITVTVKDKGKTISFDCSIQYPSKGTAPYPAMIGMGMNTLNTSVIRDMGVALITLPVDEIAQQSGTHTRGRGKFYDLYGSNHSAGALMAWAWAASRLIDALEVTPSANIDPARIAVTGGSRYGKGALAAGAFDERIALTIPQESGCGGTSSWRVAEAQKASGQNVQTLSHIITEQPWLSKSIEQFVNQTNKLPVDQHMILGMCAPRGLLVIENTGMEWLGNLSCYTSSQAARLIYEALGVKDHMGFSQVGGHMHCAFPDSQIPELRAFIQKFLLGDNSANTNVNKTDGNFSFDKARWADWSVPTLR